MLIAELINFLPARVIREEGDWTKVEAAGAQFDVPHRGSSNRSTDVTIAIRPEHLKILSRNETPEHDTCLAGRIEDQTYTGNLLTVRVQMDHGPDLMVECRPDDELPAAGTPVTVAWARERAIMLEE